MKNKYQSIRRLADLGHLIKMTVGKQTEIAEEAGKWVFEAKGGTEEK